MINQILDYTIWVVLVAHLLMTLVAAWRAWRGENAIARLAGLDLSGTLMIAVLVIVSIIRRNSIFIDLSIAAAALSYLSTIALSKFISDRKVF